VRGPDVDVLREAAKWGSFQGLAMWRAHDE
jgi:hypothetical protein